MREHYKYHYFGSSSPSARKPRDYNDPAWTAEERERNAALFAKQKAAFRRAKIAERCIVFGVAALVVIITQTRTLAPSYPQVTSAQV